MGTRCEYQGRFHTPRESLQRGIEAVPAARISTAPYSDTVLATKTDCHCLFFFHFYPICMFRCLKVLPL